MLKDEPWIEVAQFASYSVQGDVLRLKPWESPPSCPSGDVAAWQLLQKDASRGRVGIRPPPASSTGGRIGKEKEGAQIKMKTEAAAGMAESPGR
jgi:hypothetical protein